MSEYSESEDFEHHESEVRDCLRTLRDLGIVCGNSERVLDLGAGHGMHAGFLSEYFREVHCADIIDYSSLYGGEFLKLLEEKHRRNSRPFDLSKMRFCHADAQSLLYRNDFFDFVFTVNTFEHIPDPGLALAEILRVLKPGGHAYISFDPIWTADTGSHFSHLVDEPWAHLVLAEKQFIRRMLEAGADDNQVNDFKFAMNRKTMPYFQNLFKAVDRARAEIVLDDSWRGTVRDESTAHANFRLALGLGYSEDELMVRGLRYVIRKPG